MNNVLFFSDIHLHSHKKSSDRLDDGIQVLKWVFDTAIKNSVESVVFGGDLFHDRTKIEVLTLFRVFEVFEHYFGNKKPFDLYLLLGNHDMWHRDKWDVYSPAFLKAFDGVHVVDKPCAPNIQGEFIDFLPFTENPINDLNALRDLAPRKPGEKRLLVSHLALDGAKLNSFTEADVVVEHDHEMVKIDYDTIRGWTQVYLGHYHGEQTLGDREEIEYIGSPYELTKSEAGQRKHIILHDMDTFQKRYIINDFSPKHLILKPAELSQHDLSKHFVTVMMPTASSQSELVDIRQQILRDHNVGSLDFKNEHKRKTKDQEQEVIKDARAILETHDKMLQRYIDDSVGKDGMDLDLLLKIGKRIVETDTSDEEGVNSAKIDLHPSSLHITEFNDVSFEN